MQLWNDSQILWEAMSGCVDNQLIGPDSTVPAIGIAGELV
jgi:hypothetical protein